LLGFARGTPNRPDHLPDIWAFQQTRATPGGPIPVDDAGKVPGLQAFIEQQRDERRHRRLPFGGFLIDAFEKLLG
jgi:hypothetical protein